MQMEALECGAAALSMILAYYGKWIVLEEMRISCGVSRDGSNAKNILRAARTYGLDAKGYTYEIETLKQLNVFPCILFWEFNHFVVLNGFTHHKAILNDPARGKIAISMEEFENSFTGLCLCFQPTLEFQRSGHKKSILRLLKQHVKGARTAILFVLLTTIITSFKSLIFPLISRIYVDFILVEEGTTWFSGFLLVFLLLCSVILLAQWIQAIYAKRLEGKLAIRANAEFMWHVLRLPLEFFAQRRVGDLVLRKINNEDTAHTIIETLAPLCLHGIMMLFYLYLMFKYQIGLAIIGICGVLLNIFISKCIANKRMNVNRVLLKSEGQMWTTTVAGIELMESLKASGAEANFFERWAGNQASLTTQKMRNANINAHLGTLSIYVLHFSNLCILGIGVFLIMDRSFQIGMLLAFQGFMTAFLAPAEALSNAIQIIQESRANMERIEDVLAYPCDVQTPTFHEEQTYEKLRGTIELQNVTFGYSRLEEPLIENFSMKIEPGKKIAFVGSSGCGKSTLSKLISGVYAPSSGEILFDGIPMKEIDRSVFTSSLAVVDQDITLFEDSIAENIKMWDRSIADYEMIIAARDANIHSAILERANGFRYRIQAGGNDFSGGQRQRLEIARVLAQDPTILILDEATSALDSQTEFEVVKSIQKRGITCIVIAHRLSTIRDCDEIIVLHHGQVVERGTHETLFAMNGFYTQLVSNE